MKANLLVTGASGFVGRELCSQLVAAGNSVTGIGRSSGQNIPRGMTYVSADLEVQSLNSSVFNNVDCVVHLAGQAHGRGDNTRQILEGFQRANVDVSMSLAKLAIKAGVRRFVFVSSIGVHGTVTRGEAISESTPFNPATPYAVSKMQAEQELEELFEASSSTELTIVRPPLVYGLNAPGNFGRLLRLADTRIPLPFGMCSNRRSIISLTSLVEFLITCVGHPSAAGQAFVVADSSVVSTREIISSLREGMRRRAWMVPVPPILLEGALGLLAKHDMFTQLFCDLEIESHKARALLGWKSCNNTSKSLELIGEKFVASRN